MNTKTCPVEGCARAIATSGLCRPHTEARNKAEGKHCTGPDCDRGAIKRNLCDSHYRQHRMGEDLKPIKARRSIPNPEHGTAYRYGRGCRCADCTEAKRIEVKRWQDEYKAKHGKGYWSGRPRTRTTYERVCEYCGEPYTTRSHEARYCSSTCGVRDAAGWSKAKTLAVYVRPPRSTDAPLNVIASNGLYTAGTCRVCGDAFVSHHAHITCSTACRTAYKADLRNEAKHRRRARLRKAYREKVIRREVYERDGYRCHLCGKLTKRGTVGYHPQAPTLDHIIPLAQGGTHEPSNIATAHSICNSLKGDRNMNDQLLLFG